MTCWYHTTPSKLCDACMREQAKAAEQAVPAWADMGDAAEVHGSAAIDFAMLDFSGDAKWEQRAVEFTAEKQRDGWLGGVQLQNPEDAVHFGAGLDWGWHVLYPAPGAMVLTEAGEVVPLAGVTVPVPLPPIYQEALNSGRLLRSDPSRPAPQAMTVTSVDTERGVITFSSKPCGCAFCKAPRGTNPGMEVAGLKFIPDPRVKQDQVYVVGGGLESWLPKAGDGASFLGVERSRGIQRALPADVKRTEHRWHRVLEAGCTYGTWRMVMQGGGGPNDALKFDLTATNEHLSDVLEHRGLWHTHVDTLDLLLDERGDVLDARRSRE